MTLADMILRGYKQGYIDAIHLLFNNDEVSHTGAGPDNSGDEHDDRTDF